MKRTIKITKIILCIIGSLILIMILLLIFSTTFNTYVRDYFAALDLRRRSYDNILERFGEPLSIVSHERREHLFTAQYDGIEFILSGRTRSAWVSAMRIFGSEYRFGRRRIGVGSTREEVISAYNDGRLHRMAKWLERSLFNDGRPVQNGQMWDNPDGGFTIVDGIHWVRFYFDEDDRVMQIDISAGGP